MVGVSSLININDVEHFLMIYDENGNEKCIKKTGTPGYLYGVAIDSDNNIFVTGLTLENNNNNINFYTTKYTDNIPPTYNIQKPKDGYLYLLDREIKQLSKNSIVFGKISIELDVDNPSDVYRVEFIIDYHLRESLYGEPYVWTWSDFSFGKHIVTIIIYDSNGNGARNELLLWKFF